MNWRYVTRLMSPHMFSAPTNLAPILPIAIFLVLSLLGIDWQRHQFTGTNWRQHARIQGG